MFCDLRAFRGWYHPYTLHFSLTNPPPPCEGGLGAYKAVTDMHPYDYWLGTVIIVTTPVLTTAIKPGPPYTDPGPIVSFTRMQ